MMSACACGKVGFSVRFGGVSRVLSSVRGKFLGFESHSPHQQSAHFASESCEGRNARVEWATFIT
jgi:hypothetical protein